MDLLTFFTILNYRLAIPTSFILFGTAIYLTYALKLIQFRSFSRFLSLLIDGVKTQKKSNVKNAISPIAAMFTAMSTSLGIGTIIGPSVAIIMGGPGALFWLIFYCVFASVIKFAEVTFAVHFRDRTKEGLILGGPMEYLTKAQPWLGQWYAYATIILFAGWTSVQANVIAETLAQEYVPEWLTGMLIAVLVFIMLNGGAKRVGAFSSKIVPVMSVLYLIACLSILYLNRFGLNDAFGLIFNNILSSTPAVGGFLGASIFSAFRSGIYKGAYITESGVGTAAIPHSMADVARPSDQGVLAMISVFADTFLCLLSGLLVLTTNVWKINYLSNILMYKIFGQTMPLFGRPILILTITLFALSTIIGNSFNGRQSFASITQYKYLMVYYIFICLAIFFGAVSNVPLVWAIIEVLLPFVVIPNALSIIYLAKKYRHILLQ
jgi:AGCS family alanine or glycine:cation symporter